MDKPKQMIVVRRDLKMRKGKIAAQAGHACVTAVAGTHRADKLHLRLQSLVLATQISIPKIGGLSI